MEKRRFSTYFYNPITYFGVALSIFVFCLELILYFFDVFVSHDNLYLGLLAYLVLPPFLIIGILLIPLGALWEKRRARRGKSSLDFTHFHIDLSKRTHRNAVMAFVLTISIFFVASVVGLYKTYHYTDSVQFCGQLCHTVMKPEFTAYHDSPHSRVKCVECHIGGGAQWYVRSKLSGSYQVYATLINNYPKPIPSPVKNLRPARETCEQCHWPEYFYSSKEKTFYHFLSDEKNTYWPIRMLIKVGGGKPGGIGQTGIHWHMNINNDIQYISSDEQRQNIIWLKLTNKKTGEVQEYHSEGKPISSAEISKNQIRHFDCIDCHNRPTHKFLSPVTAVNEALVAERINKDLPFIKREVVKVLCEKFKTTEEAIVRIRERLTEFYKNNYPEVYSKNISEIGKAIIEVQNIFRKTQFPEMNVRWDTHPDNIGHIEHLSCFRCHGTDLVNKEGQKIEKNCNTCHTILSQGPGSENKPIEREVDFTHPVELGMDPKEMDCVGCHADPSNLY